MHIVGLILAPLLFYTVYWFINMNGHEWLASLWDAKKREERARRVAENERMATLRAIRDPREAAGALMFAVARQKGDITREQIAAIETEAKSTLGIAEGRRLVEFVAAARHVAGTAPSATVTVQELAPLLVKSLSDSEKADLIAMLERVAAVDGAMSEEQVALIARVAAALPAPETGWGQRPR